MEPKEPLTVRRLIEYLQTLPQYAFVMRDDHSDPCIVENPPELRVGRRRIGSNSVSLRPIRTDFDVRPNSWFDTHRSEWEAQKAKDFAERLRKWEEDRLSLSEDLEFVLIGKSW
jgi:hypothetical protein